MGDNPISILIVEGDPGHAELMERALSDHNTDVEVETADSAAECCTMLDQGKYNAIILDHALPKVDSLEALKVIYQRGHDIPVIIMTGSGEEKIAAEAIKQGGYSYITKSGDYLLTLPLVLQKTLEQNTVAKEKAKLAQEIKETKGFWGNLLENANDIIYTLDGDGRITYVNQAVEKYGMTKEKLVGKDFFSLLPEKQSRDQFKDTTMNEARIHFGRAHNDGKGETTYFLLSTSSLREKHGKTDGTYGIARDITETKRWEQKQHEIEIELMEQHKISSLSTLIQGIAHNMNSPLTGILGRTQLLERRLIKQKKRLARLSREAEMEGMDEILLEYDKALRDTASTSENVERLAGIIRNMMYKGRQEQTDELQLISINELLREELAFLEANMFFKHDVTKKYNFADSVPYIKAVYSDFSQSIINIINNALDAMYDSEEKELTITTRLEGEDIYVDTHDTGGGIKEDYFPMIFDPFFTTKPTNSSDGSPTGIGLGLHSAYVLLKKYDVRIDAKSKPGDTTFTLRIPIRNHDKRTKAPRI